MSLLSCHSFLVVLIYVVVVFILNYVLNFSTFPGLVDEVNYPLPEVNFALHYRHYSGYLKSHNRTYLHYWFFESQSASAANDSVVLWLNGGPGCSSLIGALNGVGPLKMNTPNGSIIRNPFSWNLNANLLFLESPTQVGFSYQINPPADFVPNDSTTAQLCGIYIPTLSMLIVEHNFPVNFKGISLGNALLDHKLAFGALYQYAFVNELISQNTWNGIVKECCPVDYRTLRQCVLYNKSTYNNQSPLTIEGYESIFVNSVQQVDCYLELERVREQLDKLPINSYNIKQVCPNATTCPNQFDRLIEWFNRDSIQVALKISSHAKNKHSKVQWRECNGYGTNSKLYDKNVNSVRDMMHRLLDNNIKVLLYYGQLDHACNYISAEMFIDDLNLTTTSVTSQLTPYYDSQNCLIGHIKQLPYGLVYVKIVEAGHDVLSYKPEEMLKIFQDFLLQSRLSLINNICATNSSSGKSKSIFVGISRKSTLLVVVWLVNFSLITLLKY